MPVDIVNGNGNGKPGVMLGNGNGNGLTMGPWTLDRPNPVLQNTGLGNGVQRPTPLPDNPKNNGTQQSWEFLDGNYNTNVDTGPGNWGGGDFGTNSSLLENLNGNNPLGLDSGYSGGGGDFGEGDYNYEEDNLVNRPIAKSNNQNYIQPLMGEKKII